MSLNPYTYGPTTKNNKKAARRDQNGTSPINPHYENDLVF